MQQIPLLFSSSNRSLNLQFVLQTLLAPDLKKLHFYCDRLIQTSVTSPDALQQLLHQMSRGSQFDDALPKFFTALLPFFDEIGRDETLLSYCLEHREEFNQLFGLRAIENFLLHLFPLGIDELRLYLREKYEERGFYDYSAQQEALLSKLRL